MTNEPYYVSAEWAMQLAEMDMGFEEIPFESVKLSQVRAGTRRVRLPYPDDTNSLGISWETVYVSRYYDAINGEYTPLGYSERTNTLLYGPTRKR